MQIQRQAIGVLKSERLLVRPFEPEEGEVLGCIRADPGFRRFMLPPDSPFRPQIDVLQQKARELSLRAKRTIWGPRLVLLKETREVVGLCGLINSSPLPLPEISFCVLEAHRCKGYCKEALQLFLGKVPGMAFGAFVQYENESSLGIVKWLGMQRCAEIQHPVLQTYGWWFELPQMLSGDSEN